MGSYCESEYTSFMFPSFKNYSFLELNTDNNFNELNLEIEFQATKLFGIIFFASEFSDGSGDLLAILIRDGFIEMRQLFLFVFIFICIIFHLFSTSRLNNVADGFKVYVLPNVIKIGKFHRLFIQKRKNQLLMQLDDYLPFQSIISQSYISIEKRFVLGNFKALKRFSYNR
jgi:hypothetical protein